MAAAGQPGPFSDTTSPNDPQYTNHSIGVGLKSKSEPLLLESTNGSTEQHPVIDSDYATSTGGGASPPASLTDKLFKQPTAEDQPDNPSGLGMNKDAFFSMPTWSAGRLQCSASLP